MTRYGTPAVECYKYEGKEVGFARDVWLYLYFMLVAVVFVPPRTNGTEEENANDREDEEGMCMIFLVAV